jgi:hypothetical protein
MDEWELQSLIHQRGNVLRHIKSEEQRQQQREKYERLKSVGPVERMYWNSQRRGTYRNPSKRQRRLAIKLLGRRQLLKSFKRGKREVTL